MLKTQPNKETRPRTPDSRVMPVGKCDSEMILSYMIDFTAGEQTDRQTNSNTHTH